MGLIQLSSQRLNLVLRLGQLTLSVIESLSGFNLLILVLVTLLLYQSQVALGFGQLCIQSCDFVLRLSQFSLDITESLSGFNLLILELITLLFHQNQVVLSLGQLCGERFTCLYVFRLLSLGAL